MEKHISMIGQVILWTSLIGNQPAFSQEVIIKGLDESNEVLQELTEELEGMEVELGDLKIDFEHKGDIRLGLYISDLDFKDAYEKHYPHCYGVLVTGLTSGGNGQNAGLVKGDIIMEFDGEKVLFEDHLLSLRDSKQVGDSVELTIFRNEQIINKTLTFNLPQPRVDKNGKVLKSKKRKSVGYGGGGPLAFIINYDLGLDEILDVNDFQSLDIPLVLIGGFGMGNVGNGLFIGGMGAGTQLTQQIPYNDPITNKKGYKRYQLDFGFGGVTVTKKYALFSKKVILDFGLLLGGGQTKLTMATSDGIFAWDSVVQDMNSNSFQFEKSFMVYRPSAGVLVRINSWFGVTANVGYLGTYSPEPEWKESNFDFTVTGNSPKNIGHTSYTIGIWFGN